MLCPTRLIKVFACWFCLVGGVAAEEGGKEPSASMATNSPSSDEPALQRKVDKLVPDLAADRAEIRTRALTELEALAGEGWSSADRLLEALPKISADMPPALREQLASLRQRIESRAADLALQPTRVAIACKREPLQKVLAEIERQTGNKLSDYREQFGQADGPTPITVASVDSTFWETLDSVLDSGKLSLYPFANQEALAIIAREPGAATRSAAPCYRGPFRIEATQGTSKIDLRRSESRTLELTVELAWEPRLQPIALSHALSTVAGTTETGEAVAVINPEGSIDLETQSSSKSAELTLSLATPDRKAQSIASLRGVISALVPGRRVEFRFAGLDRVTAPVVQSRGGVSVTLQTVRKNNAIWEVHMRMKLRGAGDALASHRGWVFENRSYLVESGGEQIESAGFETTMQTDDEVGIAYLFELPDGPKGLTWVYETPASIVETPIEYELKGIALP